MNDATRERVLMIHTCTSNCRNKKTYRITAHEYYVNIMITFRFFVIRKCQCSHFPIVKFLQSGFPKCRVLKLTTYITPVMVVLISLHVFHIFTFNRIMLR